MIVAGYERALRECFFEHNEGLARRFPYRYHISGYQPAELREIFLRQVRRDGWAVEPSAAPLAFFEGHRGDFEFNGGCTENLLHKAKLAHARRVFGAPAFGLRVLNARDVEQGNARAADDGWDKISHIYM